MTYRARIYSYGPEVLDEVRVVVMDEQSRSLLLADGTWSSAFPEGNLLPENAGFRLPATALSALHGAIAEWQGKAALREYLKAERSRLDAVISEAPTGTL